MRLMIQLTDPLALPVLDDGVEVAGGEGQAPNGRSHAKRIDHENGVLVPPLAAHKVVDNGNRCHSDQQG